MKATQIGRFPNRSVKAFGRPKPEVDGGAVHRCWRPPERRAMISPRATWILLGLAVIGQRSAPLSRWMVASNMAQL